MGEGEGGDRLGNMDSVELVYGSAIWTLSDHLEFGDIGLRTAVRRSSDHYEIRGLRVWTAVKGSGGARSVEENHGSQSIDTMNHFVLLASLSPTCLLDNRCWVLGTHCQFFGQGLSKRENHLVHL